MSATVTSKRKEYRLNEAVDGAWQHKYEFFQTSFWKSRAKHHYNHKLWTSYYQTPHLSIDFLPLILIFSLLLRLEAFGQLTWNRRRQSDF